MKYQDRFHSRIIKLVSLTIPLACILLHASLVHAQNYQVVIYQPPPGISETQGLGIGGLQRVGAGRITGATYPDYTHALLWTGSVVVPIDLHPPGWTYSSASATNGSQQVGYVEGHNYPYTGRHAALWSGTPSSLVLLSPVESGDYSEALSIAGDQQVGYVDSSFGGNEGGYTYIIHATLWRGTPESMVDLHPQLPGVNAPGDQRSKAFDTDGTSQVGYTNFYVSTGGGYRSETRAMLWHGTAQSAVILHPTGWDDSYAYGVKNNTQVGYGIQDVNNSPVVALVWHGTAASIRFLGEGTALDTNGTTHVGTKPSGYNNHAFRWDGDTGQGFDLHTLLPPGYENSIAEDIDDAGNIIGLAQRPDGHLDAVLWSVGLVGVTSGDVLVSEFRLSGPAGPNAGARDEFVELYNNTNAPITVGTEDGSSGWALVASDSQIKFVVPNGTTIPAHAHYLATNVDYSLGAAAAGDLQYSTDIPANAGLALFRTSNPSNFTTANRLDAVGFTSDATMYRAGGGLAPISASAGPNEQCSFARRLTNGTPQNTGDNSADFVLVSTTGTVGGSQAILGAPGPENIASPMQRNAQVKASLLDAQAASTAAPNRVRDAAPLTNGQYGTLIVRRKFTNKTGQSITQLRFRIIDITTAPAAANVADLRVLSANDANVTLTNGTTITVKGTVLDQPPVQSGGGGLNSTITVALPGGALAPNGSVNVQFVLGVQQPGTFRFFINTEALPGLDGTAASRFVQKQSLGHKEFTPTRP
ncbi:MAG: hypothetical protein ACJ74W_09015 [Pyrinomonadaceae bacterium]